MEDEARVASEPGEHLRLLVGGVVVEDDMDDLAGRHVRFDGVEEADELLVPVALHAAAEHAPVEHVEGGEQGGGAVALVVVGHGAGAACFMGRPGWVRSSAWIWRLLVDRQHHGMGWRVDIEADDVLSLGTNSGSFESLKRRSGAATGRAPSRCAAPRTR